MAVNNSVQICLVCNTIIRNKWICCELESVCIMSIVDYHYMNLLVQEFKYKLYFCSNCVLKQIAFSLISNIDFENIYRSSLKKEN